jgi:hypothetical protein
LLARGRVERGVDVFFSDMKGAGIVEEAVVAFPNERNDQFQAAELGIAATHVFLDRMVSDAHTHGGGENDGCRGNAPLVGGRTSRDLAKAIEDKAAGRERFAHQIAACGPDGGYTRLRHAALVVKAECGVTYAHIAHVRDAV